MLAFVWILAAYLIGSIPFGLMIGLRVKGVDIRDFGSGNLGATNAGRVLGKRWGIIVLCLDFMKGFLPLLALRFSYGSLPETDSILNYATCISIAAAVSVIGHMFPVYLKFKGGKGVATSIGVLMAIQWLPGACGIGVFILVLLVSKYVSLAAMSGAVVVPIAAWFSNPAPLHGDLPYTIFTLGIAVMVLVKHRSNITRILDGTEARITDKKEDLEDIKLS